MKKLIIAVSILGAFAAVAADKAGVHMPVDTLKWEQPFGPQGPSVAFVVGDAKSKGPVTFFLKLPAGADSGWHIHDGDYFATVIKGTPSAQGMGEAAETTLPVGSFFSEPGKHTHRNGCSKDGDCTMFVHMEKGFTSHPMTADGKPAPAMKPDAKMEEKKAPEKAPEKKTP